MADPPAYDTIVHDDDHGYLEEKSEGKNLQQLSIREEVGVSRTQHIAALVSRLLPQIRERARSGLAKSTLLLLPSDQGNAFGERRKGIRLTRMQTAVVKASWLGSPKMSCRSLSSSKVGRTALNFGSRKKLLCCSKSSSWML